MTSSSIAFNAAVFRLNAADETNFRDAGVSEEADFRAMRDTAR